MKLNVEFLVGEVLNFLFFPRLVVSKEFEGIFLLVLAELRGWQAPKFGERRPRPPSFQRRAQRVLVVEDLPTE
jgi:hypothetical protein